MEVTSITHILAKPKCKFLNFVAAISVHMTLDMCILHLDSALFTLHHQHLVEAVFVIT